MESAEFTAAIGKMVSHLRDHDVNPGHLFEMAQAFVAMVLCSDEGGVVAAPDGATDLAFADFIDEHEAEISEMILRAAFRSSFGGSSGTLPKDVQ